MLTLLNEIRSLPTLTLSLLAFMVLAQYVTTAPYILSGVRGAVQTLAGSGDSRQQNLESLIQFF